LKLSQINVQASDEKWPLWVFNPLQVWGFRATYTTHLRLIGKLVVDFLFVLFEHFSLGVGVHTELCEPWFRTFTVGLVLVFRIWLGPRATARDS